MSGLSLTGDRDRQLCVSPIIVDDILLVDCGAGPVDHEWIHHCKAGGTVPFQSDCPIIFHPDHLRRIRFSLLHRRSRA